MQPFFPLNGLLTAEHLNFYHENGFLHFKRFIDKDNVSLFISEINRINHQLIAEGVSKINGIPLKFGTVSDGRPLVQRLAFASKFSPILAEFLKDPRFTALFTLLGNYEGRIGDNEKDGLVVNHYENTPESKFKQMGWHTDSPRDLFLGSRILPMLNVGLHLDDYPAENGGLRVLPGTHKQNLFSLFFRKKYFVDHNPDPAEVGFDIEAGDLTIHNGNLWHRVQQSKYEGEKSRRRVMYIPIITGAFQPKHTNSKTPFYHLIGQLQIPKFRLQS